MTDSNEWMTKEGRNRDDLRLSWQVLQERAQTCPILNYYFAAYKVFGPDADISREQFLATLALKLHDRFQASQKKAIDYAAKEMCSVEYIREKMGSNNAVSRGSLFSWLENIMRTYYPKGILPDDANTSSSDSPRGW